MIVNHLSKGIRLALCVAGYLGLISSVAQAAVLNPNFSYNHATNVLTDGNTGGLSWLNLNQSRGRSYNDVSGEFGTGGDFAGYRYATGAEVNTLVSNWVGYVVSGTLKNFHPDGPAGSDYIDDLITFIGDTYNDRYFPGPASDGISYRTPIETHFSMGIIADSHSEFLDRHWLATLRDENEDYSSFIDYTDIYNNTKTDSTSWLSAGSFLVQNQISTVPLPAAFPLYGAGIAVLGFIGWRRKRKA